MMTLCNFSVSSADNSAVFAGGDGSESNPYQVSTPEQLNEVRNHLDAYFIQTADIDLTAATAQGGIFYNDGSGWEPIGTDANTPFGGNYNGGGHYIIGLKSKQSECAGLFGYNGGVIQNLGMDGGAVLAFSYAGGVSGVNRGTIANCYNTGSVSSTSYSVYSYAGGIAGDNDEGTITNCYNTGAVSALNLYAGGIAGCSNDGTITNCYYYDAPNLRTKGGTALTLDELKQQESYAGFDFETIWKFENESYYPFPILCGMAVPEQEEENTTDFAGGTGRLENPYRVATVEHLNNVRNNLGVYFIQTADIDLTAATAEGGAFYNDGSGWLPIGTDAYTPFGGNYNGGGHRIIGLKSKQSDLGTPCGGLFGYNSGVIQNLGMDGGAVLTFSYAGGIVGDNRGTITNCYNTGSVSSTSYAGGIAGYSFGIITNCYNTGSVLSSLCAGGIAGSNNDSIKNCYNTGAVSSSSRMGGITGEDRGAFINCYYYDAPNLKIRGGIALTLDELKQKTYYTGFDFETAWEFDAESGYPFPLLHGVTPPQQEKENITDFSGGTGRLENPYKVSSAEQLNHVRDYLGAYFIQTADIDLTALTAEGGAFYNDGSGWEPIGTDANTPFGGNYNGGGYCIIGLKSCQSCSEEFDVGLFGCNSGVIQNLGIENGEVSVSYFSSASSVTVLSSCAGGIAGRNNGSIINCYNTGTVSSSSYSDFQSYAGGIAGSNNGSIENCYNTGTVSASSTYVGAAGGIAGYNSNGNITNCYNTGTVLSSTSASNSFLYAGGIVGKGWYGSVTNCCNTGMVSSSSSNSHSYVGGVAGEQRGDSTIASCYNAGEITAESNTKTVHAGGIAGYSEYSVSYGKATLTNVFNTGKVTARTNGTDRYAYAGGLAGYTNGGNISYGYSIGEVQGSPQYTGKVVGNNEGGTISQLYFTGVSNDVLGIGNEENAEDKVEFKSAEQMKQQATFVGFDFDTVWSISSDKNGGYPILQGLPAPEEIPTVPEEPNETNVSVNLSEKSYDEATGTYSLIVTVNNQSEEPLTGTVFVAAYDSNHLIDTQKYSITELSFGQAQTFSAKIVTNKKVGKIKVFCWDTLTLRPLSAAVETAG